MDKLQAEVRRHRPWLVLDLDEATLADIAVVRCLVTCKAEGIELRQRRVHPGVDGRGPGREE